MSQNNFLHEELGFEDQEVEESDDNNNDVTDNLSDLEDLDIEIASIKKGYQITVSEQTAANLYRIAGTEETEVNNEMTVLPKPHVISSLEEQLISQTKTELNISFELDNFQVQALIAIQNNQNVVLLSPCGSGKLLVYYMAVHIMRKKLNLPKGLGLCLQPLNNILTEKTNSDPPIPTAYLTMSGEGMKADNVSLSHSLDEITRGDIGCLLGHAESFLSPKGEQ